MTNEELNRKMAENVMGWRGYGDWWETQDLKDQIMKMSDWQPTRLIEQAMMVHGKWEQVGHYTEINHDAALCWHVYLFQIREYDALKLGQGEGDTLQLAICRAVEAAWETGGDADEAP